MPAVAQPKSKSTCAATAMSSAVANVPTVPSTPIGTNEARKRRQPTCMPPSKRMTISATTPIRSTSLIDSASASDGNMSDATAAASRKTAGAGIGRYEVSLLATTASETPPATTSTTVPKALISSIG